MRSKEIYSVIFKKSDNYKIKISKGQGSFLAILPIHILNISTYNQGQRLSKLSG